MKREITGEHMLHSLAQEPSNCNAHLQVKVCKDVTRANVDMALFISELLAPISQQLGSLPSALGKEHQQPQGCSGSRIGSRALLLQSPADVRDVRHIWQVMPHFQGHCNRFQGQHLCDSWFPINVTCVADVGEVCMVYCRLSHLSSVSGTSGCTSASELSVLTRAMPCPGPDCAGSD